MGNSSNSFIRKSFYISPPEKGSDADEWSSWLESDRKAAIKAKRAFTKAQDAEEAPENFQPTSCRKVNGVWKSATCIGFSGDVENGGTLEPVVAENQERDYITAHLQPQARGVSHSRAGNEKRKNRRLRRKLKRGE